jgi:2-C-methyl-D-erythritol 4-phosphate cytidylyltransferase
MIDLNASDKNRIAIIVAGGEGKRMGSTLPKQFLEINGKPIILITINRFLEARCKVIVVLPQNHIETFKTLCIKHNFNYENVIITVGGIERYESVKNGISLIGSDFNGYVAIHDAVRPFIKSEKIIDLFELCKLKKAVAPAIDVKDSIRKVLDSNKNYHVNRHEYKLVQTPQIFEFSIINKAYRMPIPNYVTDDATLVELSGYPIYLAPGDSKNIKITTPDDLTYAEFLLKHF